jgi:hypothetical protein
MNASDASMSHRVTVRRFLHVAIVVYMSWLGMQAIHELGHIVAAWMTGGTVVRVVLHPLTISRTEVSPNPSPLFVAWGGPLIGVAIPLLISVAVRIQKTNTRARNYADFFAGFCLIANGVYIGIGSFDRIGDAGDLLRHGSPKWALVVFGMASSIGGLFLWHRALERRRGSASEVPLLRTPLAK